MKYDIWQPWKQGSASAVEAYDMVKSIMMMWNPEASKWAGNASRLYK
jgi:hypothetical protein